MNQKPSVVQMLKSIPKVLTSDLTWTADIFEIISYASRAFAAYYTLQAALATLGSWGQGDKLSTLKNALITLIAFFAAIFGTAVE